MTADLVSDEQLAEWERRVEAATDGEWYVQRRSGSLLEVRAAWPDEDLHLASVEYLSDADLIVAARNAFPLLLRALRDARGEVERAKEREHALIRAKDADLDDARDEIKNLRGGRRVEQGMLRAALPQLAEIDSLRAENGRLRKEVIELNKAYEGADYLREQVAAERDELRREVERLGGVGRCGVASPAVLPGVPQARCDLRAGHAGWHAANDGTEWCCDSAALAAPTGQEKDTDG